MTFSELRKAAVVTKSVKFKDLTLTFNLRVRRPMSKVDCPKVDPPVEIIYHVVARRGPEARMRPGLP